MISPLPDQLTTELLSYLEFKRLAEAQSASEIWYALGQDLKRKQALKTMNELNVAVKEIHNNLEGLYKKLMHNTICGSLSPLAWQKLNQRLIKLSADKNGLKEFATHLQGYLESANEAQQASLTKFNEHHEQINRLLYQCLELLKHKRGGM